jgi:type II restriction enzyme
MTDQSNLSNSLLAALAELTPSQLDLVAAVIRQFHLPHQFVRNENSNFITSAVMNMLGDALRIHHAFSRQALSKDRFEYALERSLCRAGIHAELVGNRTNRGHDITIEGVPVSLKTQADANIRADTLHISKFMELGKGAWDLPLLRDTFLHHMQSYERIFQFRCLEPGPITFLYELVEIPKSLLMEGANARLVTQKKSTQKPKPGYGYVRVLTAKRDLNSILTEVLNANSKLRNFRRSCVSFTQLGDLTQRRLSSRFLAKSAYSLLISIPVHARPSSLQTTPVVPAPKNGSSTRLPFLDPAAMQSLTKDRGYTAKCAPAYGSVFTFQTLRLFLSFCALSCVCSCMAS